MKTGAASQLIDFFFMELYQSAAEPLPDRFGSGTWDELNPQASKDCNAQLWNPDLPLPQEIQALTADVLGIPVRYLPPGRPHDIYLQYLGWFDDLKSAGGLDCAGVGGVGEVGGDRSQKPAAFNTFWLRWSGKWKDVLKFWQEGHHSSCQTCFELRRAMQAARADVTAKINFSRLLRQHIRDQYQDRPIYWGLRFASRQYQDVLVIIVDSMDKTKFAIPRYGFPEHPKELENLSRPKLVCTAAIAHGWCTYIGLSDESTTHGGDHFSEVVLRVLQKVSEMSEASGRPLPRHLVIQADNTPSQCKNGVGTLLMALLAGRRKFITTSLMFLRVGHTHEDIGARPRSVNTHHM